MKGVSKNRGRAHVLVLVATLLAAALLPLQTTLAQQQQPTITATPASQAVGKPVVLEGTGWYVLSDVKIYINRTPTELIEVATVKTNETGGFKITVTVPLLRPDAYTWYAAQPGTPNKAKCDFTIEEGIYATPEKAPVGATVRILGASESFINKKVLIIFDKNNNGTYDAGENLTITSGNAEGIIDTAITIPDVRYGTYNIYANKTTIDPGTPLTTGNSLSTSFTVERPTVTVTPDAAPVGYTVTISGNKFKVNYYVNITLRDAANKIVAILATKVLTNATGGFKVAVTVPDVKVTADTGFIVNATDDINWATKTLTVKAPKITITPDTAKVGDSITVKANWFKVEWNVTIYFSIRRSGTVYELIPVATVPANETGGFVATVTVPAVPADTPAGVTDLVQVNASDGVNFALFDFDVIPSATLDRYRIAVGQNLTITGLGFRNDSVITIKINGSNVPPTLIGTAKTDKYGSFKVTITMPQVPDGYYMVNISDAVGNKVYIKWLQVVPKEFADLFAAIDAIERKLDSETFGLAAIKSAIDLLDARVRAIVYRLGSFTGEDTIASLLYDIRAKVEAIQLDLTPVLNAINSTRTDVLGAIASAKEEILAKIDFTPVLKAVNGTRTDVLGAIDSAKGEIIAKVEAIQLDLTPVLNAINSTRTDVLSAIASAKSDVLNAISDAKTDLLSAISSAKSDIITRIDKIAAPTMSTGTGTATFTTKNTEIAIYESAKLGTVTVTLKTSGMMTYKVLSIRYYINPADPTLYVEKVVARNADAVFTDTAAAWKVTLVYTETATPAKPGVTVYYAYSALTPP